MAKWLTRWSAKPAFAGSNPARCSTNDKRSIILHYQNHRRAMKERRILKALTSTLILATSARLALHAQSAQPYQGVVGRTLAESKEWWPEPVKAPAGAPNVVWILLDDVGFGASSTFGGLISTPTFDNLAANGLRYTNFHTCAICAPTRAALLTGRNSASVHESGFSHTVLSAGFPGWDGRVPSSAGTIAEILRDNGYNTFAVGKYGVTPDEEATDAGPFDHWPTGKGFDHFFGFLGSQTDQYKPDLVEDQAHVRPDGRHLNDQITDKAIAISIARRRLRRTSRSSSTTRPAPRMLRTRWTNTGAINTRASSTRAGTHIARKSSSARRSSALFLPMRNFPIAIRTSRHGTNCHPTRRSSMRASWKCMRDTWRIPISKSAD